MNADCADYDADHAEKACLPRLYAIADAETCARKGLSVGAVARELREAGLRLVQYRNKVGSPQDVLLGAAAVAEAFAGTDALLVMNDRVDLAVLAGWRAVHAGHTDMPPEAVRKVLATPHPQRLKPLFQGGSIGTAEAVPYRASASAEGEGGSEPFRNSAPSWSFVGISTHNEEQVRAADAGDADYVAIGPVFATSSKVDTEPVVGLDGVRRARALTRKPLVAIGGITRQNARAVIEAGADSVAVIGALFVEGMTVREAAEDLIAILR